MSSVNPEFVHPGATLNGPQAIADGLLGSFTLGAGQFCTKLGPVLVEAGDRLRDLPLDSTRQDQADPVLTCGIHAAFEGGLRRLMDEGASMLSEGQKGAALTVVSADVWETDVTLVLANPDLTREIFVPSTLLIRHRVDAEPLAFASAMQGQPLPRCTATSRSGALPPASRRAGEEGRAPHAQPIPQRRRGVPRHCPRRALPRHHGRPHHLGGSTRHRALHPPNRLPELS